MAFFLGTFLLLACASECFYVLDKFVFSNSSLFLLLVPFLLRRLTLPLKFYVWNIIRKKNKWYKNGIGVWTVESVHLYVCSKTENTRETFSLHRKEKKNIIKRKMNLNFGAAKILLRISNLERETFVAWSFLCRTTCFFFVPFLFLKTIFAFIRKWVRSTQYKCYEGLMKWYGKKHVIFNYS